jgi:hypothetical protein
LVHLHLAWGAASDGTHGKGGQYDCEHNFTSIPERICSEDKKAWMDRIKNARTMLLEKETYTLSKEPILC